MYFSSVTIANTVMALILVIPSAFFIVFLDRFLKLPDGFALDIKILWAFIFVSFLISLAAGSMDVATVLLQPPGSERQTGDGEQCT